MMALPVCLTAVSPAEIPFQRVINWFRSPKGEQLQETISQCGSITILLHSDPDPDAMASAMGITHLAHTVDVEATIQYSGQIRHQENRVFRTLLGPDLHAIEHVDELAADNVILVDHNTPRGFTGADELSPLAVVDHHPGDGTGLEFTDTRPNYGSCSSIVAEYLQAVGVTPISSDQFERLSESEQSSVEVLPPSVTTGLMYGIHSDTNGLTSGCIAADFTAAAYLCAGVDETLLDRIANPQVDTEVLEIKSRAISNRTKRGPFIISGVGEISNTDAIPQAADELIQLEGVTAAVAYGRRDGTVRVSGRSHDDRVHMGDALQAVVEESSGGSAGGHSRMGGAQVPLADFSTGMDEPDPTETEVLMELENRIFAALEGDL